LLLAALTALAASACAVATEPCPAGGTASVVGSWRYAGIELAPLRTTLSGTLAVTKQSCGEFTGQVDLIEVNAQGGTRRLAGPVSGTVIDASSLRFDAFLEAVPRQHLATLAGDSLAGTWLAVDGAGQTVSGTFGGRRE
jgi:hypothetical protein